MEPVWKSWAAGCTLALAAGVGTGAVQSSISAADRGASTSRPPASAGQPGSGLPAAEDGVAPEVAPAGDSAQASLLRSTWDSSRATGRPSHERVKSRETDRARVGGRSGGPGSKGGHDGR